MCLSFRKQKHIRDSDSVSNWTRIASWSNNSNANLCEAQVARESLREMIPPLKKYGERSNSTYAMGVMTPPLNFGYKLRQGAVESIAKLLFLLEYRQMVKATVFGTVICRFESYYSNQRQGRTLLCERPRNTSQKMTMAADKTAASAKSCKEVIDWTPKCSSQKWCCMAMRIL